MSKWLLLSIAIIAEVFGTSFLKASEGFTRFWPSIAVILGYSVAFYFLALSLKVIPVGIAYAIWAGIGVVLIALIGWIVFGQKLDTAAIIGISMILVGVVVLNVFSNSITH
ncbi:MULTISPECIES: SMR family transporter [unclassified Methylophaga]|jgi:small multidrug resistance pump|uniref:DMT family transporter n=1 Tax=unclassified Methylophaga TaxID=2629249 RepID=UPI000C8D5496|nr:MULTISPECIES: SMR family transporter [unclassified Methylophaga]MAK67090.1 QacE family quaternary ammonium compound efflux SMR transporter [Methylophaga sp.]MAY18128.1 QacE family quaternary ammonium compound efflux SMR transporter [Methylophaga sp.]MBN45551.1 QacE family quaternary ammonium compound efflux SMR transporter [Methylophaga sp.]HAO25046.1 QacE family quaternary ammonium compound efflux SMR transporter [Methylophaga sp.]HCD04417.1 QacE family quaternary ammonium compound efflux |tara:strand:- start:35151 stop:35483 length:333 start_codon:yes stop_codon:yes gene_type:complete